MFLPSRVIVTSEMRCTRARKPGWQLAIYVQSGLLRKSREAAVREADVMRAL